MDNEKLINEVFGGQHRSITTGVTSTPGTHLQTSGTNHRIRHGIGSDSKNLAGGKLTPIRIDKQGFTDKGWQQELTRLIIAGNNNIFANIAPSAGKTHPIMQAFTKLIETSTRMPPVIIWVTPTKLLTAQVEREFKAQLYNILIDGKMPDHMFKNYYHLLRMISGHRGSLNDLQLSHDHVNQIRDMVNSWTASKMEISAKGVEPILGKTIAMSTTYSFAPQLIQKFKPSIVVIDEVQETFNISDVDHGSAEQVRSFYKTIQSANNSRGTSLVLMTGSMNPKTAGYITQYLDKRLGTNFKHISWETNHLPGQAQGESNKARITVLPTDITRNDMPDIITQQIRGRNSNNLFAVFGKAAITKMALDIINATPERDMKVVFGIVKSTKYRSNIPDASKTVKSQAKIASVTDTPEELYEKFNNMVDSTLKESLKHGFGYIMASDSEREYDNTDIHLVEVMFARGLIYSIIATTSVGVGVNLKVRAIYIPSIDIYQSGLGMGPMNASTLAQYVHRAGRKAGSNAIIYCNKADLEQINKIMQSGHPSEEVEVIPYDTGTDKRISILDRFKYAKSTSYQDSSIYKLFYKGDR